MERSGVVIRQFRDEDFPALLHLAARLTIGIAPWRSEAGMQAAAQTWVETSVARIGPEGAVFVAERAGEGVGFAPGAREVAFTGEAQAYIGELAVAAEAEGQGIDQALLAAVETWAREQRLSLLALDTGAANGRGRRFYARSGFQEESVRLTKVFTSEAGES
jgi:GNAT superfamily N-acetyltransferase